MFEQTSPIEQNSTEACMLYIIRTGYPEFVVRDNVTHNSQIAVSHQSSKVPDPQKYINCNTMVISLNLITAGDFTDLYYLLIII